MSFTPPATFHASSFSVFQRSLMQNDELPLADIVGSKRFAQAFEEHGVDFGDDEDAVYTPAITLWALISQTFFAQAQRSCKPPCFEWLRCGRLWAEPCAIPTPEPTVVLGKRFPLKWCATHWQYQACG